MVVGAEAHNPTQLEAHDPLRDAGLKGTHLSITFIYRQCCEILKWGSFARMVVGAEAHSPTQLEAHNPLRDAGLKRYPSFNYFYLEEML